MNNAVAIARKDFKAYFSSPIGFVLLGCWSLLYGYFFVVFLNYFVRQSLASPFPSPGSQSLNVNQQLIRPLVAQNVPILVLFLLPAVTMRSFAEEKRSGTIELLLTSPVTDVQIVLGKFVGAMGLYVTMLAVTLIHLAVLFVFSQPEWKPIATVYLGLLLLGGCFIAVGLFISSLTANQIVASVATFAVFLLLWVITWIGNLAGSSIARLTEYLSIIERFDDFGKGVIDTSHILYYVSVIALGLWLTVKSLESARWRS